MIEKNNIEYLGICTSRVLELTKLIREEKLTEAEIKDKMKLFDADEKLWVNNLDLGEKNGRR